MNVEIVTEDHFDEIREKNFSDLIVTEEQRTEILQVVNKYLLRMIHLNDNGRTWHTEKFAFIQKREKYRFLEPQILEKVKKIIQKMDGCFPYTEKKFRSLLKNTIGIKSKIYIGHYTWQRFTYCKDSTNNVHWFNYVIHMLLGNCFSAMKQAGFEKMFETEKLSQFFNIPVYIDKYLDENDLVYRSKEEFESLELFKGIEYNNRVKFLEVCTNEKMLFARLKEIAKMYDI